MLMQPQLQLNDIVIVKLATSEEVVGKLVDIINSKYLLERPRVIVPVRAGNGNEVGIQAFPLLMSYPDATTPISESHIITMIKAPANVEKTYLAQTTGLDLSATGLVG